jgi:phenylpropionate dioxygenase-like ring-hydroxylating dioxygenase large terminal subunit
MLPILPGAPWLIAHRSMLGTNKPYKITLNGRDYVLWQTDRGEIFALDNVCPHMQAPLSEGWICQKRNTIACPFHALEFDGEGRLYSDGKTDMSAVKPVAQKLEIVVKDDLIWTYGGCEPRLPIPELYARRFAEGYEFMGVAGEREINADFLSTVQINYDYNHAKGTHQEPFKLKEMSVRDYQANGYYTTVVQDVYREENTWWEVLQNPTLMLAPRHYTNDFEYAFPSTTSLITNLPSSQILSFFVLYPETENRTKTFVLAYVKTANKWMIPFFTPSSLRLFELIIEQDMGMLEHLYDREPAKIRLPNEEIMFHAEKLYREWGG